MDFLQAQIATLPPTTIILEGRKDGGLRIRSDDVKGLILSGSNPAKVIGDLIPALITLRLFGVMTLDELREKLKPDTASD